MDMYVYLQEFDFSWLGDALKRSHLSFGNLLVTVEPMKITVEVSNMALTRNFKQTVVERIEHDPEFAKALLDEAATLFLNGEPETARLILRDLVNVTLGFE